MLDHFRLWPSLGMSTKDLIEKSALIRCFLGSSKVQLRRDLRNLFPRLTRSQGQHPYRR